MHIAFDQIRARVAEHTAHEAARNAPKAVAIRAVYTLTSALADLDDTDRATVLELAPLVELTAPCAFEALADA